MPGAAPARILRPVSERAGEADAAHQQMAHQGFARILAEAGDDVDHALGDARLGQQFGEFEGAER